MLMEKMDLIYAVLKDDGFHLSSASYEKDEYHIFYKDGLILTIDLSTDKPDATMMYFDISHEFVSYTYELDTPSSFDDLLEHVSNIISTNNMMEKWNLTLYELIHLDKLIFLSRRDIEQYSTRNNLNSIKIDRIMNFDKELFDMTLGASNKNNQINLLYKKLSSKNFRIILVEKNNTGLCNITRALFIKNALLIPIFYEESGNILCGEIYMQTNKKITDNYYIDDTNIIAQSNSAYLYRFKFTDNTLEDIIGLMKNNSIVSANFKDNLYKKINLSHSINHLVNKYHSRIDSIINELSSDDLSLIGIENLKNCR